MASSGMSKHIGRTWKLVKELIQALDKQTPIRLDLTHDPPEGKKIQKGYIQFNGLLTFMDAKQYEDYKSKKEAAKDAADTAKGEKEDKNEEKKEDKKEEKKEDPKSQAPGVAADSKKSVPDPKKDDKPVDSKPSAQGLLSLKDKNGQVKLNLSNIEVHELVDTGSNSGMFKDPQDPAVDIKIGKQKFQTQRYSSV